MPGTFGCRSFVRRKSLRACFVLSFTGTHRHDKKVITLAFLVGYRAVHAWIVNLFVEMVLYTKYPAYRRCPVRMVYV